MKININISSQEKNIISIALSVVVSVFLVATVSYSATTINENINTGGTLTVSGNSILSGDLTVDTSTLYTDSTNNRVGIGTTSPRSNLHIENAGSGDLNLLLSNTNTTEKIAWGFLIDEGNADAIKFGTTTRNGSNFVSIFKIFPDTGRLTLDHNGTAAEPTFTFNDNNTGFFKDVTNTISVSLNGNETVRFTNVGVGIGTQSPSVKLDVGGDISVQGGDFNLGDGSATTTLSSAGGKIGVGTTTPSALFSVATSTATSTIHVGTGGSTTQGSCLQLYSPNGTAYAVYVNNNGTLTADTNSCE
jgi:hypothetical protein